MLNINVDMDLKLDQAEKARFANDKEHVDKKAFISELERVEKESKEDFDKRHANNKNKREVVQTIGGNLHQLDEKEYDSYDPSKLIISKKDAEQQIGGNLYKKDVSASDSEPSSNLNVSKKDAEQQIGGNLYKKGVSTSDSELSAKLNVSKQDAEQQIGGNLYKKGASASDSELSSKLNVSKKVAEQQIGGNLYRPDLEGSDSDNGLILSSSNEKPEQQIGGNLYNPPSDLSGNHVNSESVVMHNESEQKIGGNLYKPHPGDASEESSKKTDRIPLRLDESNLPKRPSNKVDEVLKVDTSDFPISEEGAKKSTKNTAVDVLNQINASTSQATDVKKHLAPVPQALKDALSQLQLENNQLVVENDKKVDQIGPPDLDKPDLLLNSMTDKDKLRLALHKREGLQSNMLHGQHDTNDNKKSEAAKLNEAVFVNGNSDKTLDSQTQKILKNAISDSSSIKEQSSTEKVSISKESKVLSSNASSTEQSMIAKISDNTSLEQVEAKLNTLSVNDKVALQQALKYAIDNEQLNDTQRSRAEAAILKLNQANQVDGEITKDLKNKPVNFLANTSLNSSSQTEVASYNSTKVTMQSLSEHAQESVEFDMSMSAGESSERLIQSEHMLSTSSRKIALSKHAETIFKAITVLPQPQGEAIKSQEHDLTIAAQQFDNAMQSAQTQQNSVNVQKMTPDISAVQVMNLQKSDAVKALQEKVNAMLSINNKEAEIRLDPPELGSMQIRIRSEAEQAQINFVVQNQQAKEALEQSLPRLKEMLAEQGIQLGESNIQQDTGSSSEQGTDDKQELAHAKLDNPEVQAQNTQQTKIHSSSNDTGIDYYA